ncbi:protein kinase [Gemmatirosa kalamazoonensis]|uniref:Protein kinase n=1 Tax=Gemmatirosa kalamazoonensis TaxID=861299 RepID=W0REL5_9BACT|nr:protein kinase [Gemmatirosa kalamazoonensis]AHG89221.1 protein kinase [Gemmatirosa kalamazoonensis]
MASAVLLERLQRALEPAYAIERELGGGGMSRVFLAEERALGRRVVVKVLAPELAEEMTAERFAREIRVAASLQQANIVPLLTTGGADGLTYYTMPYVEGRTLRDRLGGVGLPLGEAVNIARDVARALAFAHRHGVVHRDIKPENILISGGTAVVTDFGIAKAVDRARTNAFGSSSTLTRDGTSVGTPAYMSPEQCAGDPAVDHRSDIYAWGVFTYEMLAGRHPFAERRTMHELIRAHLVEPPPPLLDLRPDLPPSLAGLVERCLEKSPEQRPLAADDLVQALDVLSITGTMTSAEFQLPGVDVEAPSVAVLPFANMSPNREDEFFADGISEEIMSALARVRGLRVAARTSCFAFKGRMVDLRVMAEQLGVRTVLEGSVRRAGPRVRVSTQLVSATDGLHLWSERYDREIVDIFAVQDEIARAIADTLGTRLRGASLPMVRVTGGRPAGPASVEAYEEYLRGRLHLDQRSTNLGASIASFERAAALDPGLSVAHAGLAHVYTWLGLWYIAPATIAFAKVREAADRALSLDHKDAVALAARAIMALWYEWDWAAAERVAQQAIDAAPGLPLGYSVMTYVRVAGGQHEAAIDTAARSASLDPLSNAAKTDLGDALRYAGRHAEALEVLLPVVRREPGHILANLWVAYQLDALGDAASAVPHAERAAAAASGSPAPTAALARILARAGREAEARAIRDGLAARGASEYIAEYLLAIASVELDDHETTLARLERSVAARDPHMMLMHREYYWDALRGHPRFEALVRTVGVRRET